MKKKRKKIIQNIFVILTAICIFNPLYSIGAFAEKITLDETTMANTVSEQEENLPERGNVTINFKGVDIKTVLHYLSEVSGVDIVPAPGVEGPVTLRLRDKPWEIALDIVTRNHGFSYSSDYEEGIIRVIPKEQLNAESPITEVIVLNNLIREIEIKKKDGQEQATVEEKKESIQQLLVAVNSVLDVTRGERATYISSVNAIVVTAVPTRISDVKNMIKKIDKKTPQIMLDAKVVEIKLTKDEKFGIDWNAVMSISGAKRPITFPFTNSGALPFLGSEQRQFFPTFTAGQDKDARFPALDSGVLVDPTAAPTDGAPFSFGTLDLSTFTATLRALDKRGGTELLSSPRITTLNNQKATIKVVQKIMLQKAMDSAQASTTISVEYETPEEAREVGVKLVVIPHVNETGDVSVNLMPEVSQNDGFQLLTVGGVAQSQTTALYFSSREANTTVRVKDGETIFIGGLIKKSKLTQNNKLPILGDIFGWIPLVGSLFKYEEDVTERTEIVFFVTVHLIENGMDSIETSETEALFEKYHPKKKGLLFQDDQSKIALQDPVSGRVVGTEPRAMAVADDKKKIYQPFMELR